MMRAEEEKTPDIEAQSDLPELYYLQGFSKSELIKLKEKYKAKIASLEELLAENSGKYWKFYISNAISNFGTNGIYCAFGFVTAPQGIKASLKISDEYADVIGKFTVIMGVFLYTSLFSSHKMAAKRALDSLHRKKLTEQMSDLIAEAKANPLQTSKKTVEFLCDQSMLWIINVTGSMTLVLGIISELKKLPLGLQIVTISAIDLMGVLWFKNYLDESFYDGKEFIIKNPESYPSLWKLLREGELTTALQIFLQSASGIILRSIEFAYVSKASEKELGWWLPTYFVLAVALLQGVILLHAPTAKHYLSHQLKNHEAWDHEARVMVRHFLDHHQFRPVTVEDFDKLILLQKKLFHSQFARDVEHNNKRGYLFRYNPSTVFTIALRTGMGTYFGLGSVAPFLIEMGAEEISAKVFGTLFSAGFFLSSLYLPELLRMNAKLICEKREKAENEKFPERSIENQTPSVSTSIRVLGGIFNVFGSLGTSLSVIGMLSLLIGEDSPAAISVASIVSCEMLGNAVLFNEPLVNDSLQAMQSSAKKTMKYLTQTCAGFFSRAYEPAHAENNNERRSWCCLRRK